MNETRELPCRSARPNRLSPMFHELFGRGAASPTNDIVESAPDSGLCTTDRVCVFPTPRDSRLGRPSEIFLGAGPPIARTRPYHVPRERFQNLPLPRSRHARIRGSQYTPHPLRAASSYELIRSTTSVHVRTCTHFSSGVARPPLHARQPGSIRLDGALIAPCATEPRKSPSHLSRLATATTSL
jgi:hypothetical protein